MPTRPLVCTLNTVSNWSQPVLLIVSTPLAWLKLRAAPVRRSVTWLTLYPLSRTRSTLVLGLSMTWMYCKFGLVLLIVVAPCAPSLKNPPGIPPYMYPPPSVPPSDSQILSKKPLAKLLKLAWLDGNLPLTIAVSASSDLIDEPAFITNRPMVSFLSTAEFDPPYHHGPPV